jgi:hypothetical protein
VAQSLQVFGGQITRISGSGVAYQLTFTAGSEMAQLARVGMGTEQLHDQAGNSNTQTRWVYIPVSSNGAAVVNPVSKDVQFRAGRQVEFDVRDPLQNWGGGVWRVVVKGLGSHIALSHGTSDAYTGNWVVDAADLARLQIISSQQAAGGSRDVQLVYQNLVGDTWVNRSQAEVSVTVVPWVQVGKNQAVEDFNNFTQVREAWNAGLKGFSGRGVSIEAEGNGIQWDGCRSKGRGWLGQSFCRGCLWCIGQMG